MREHGNMEIEKKSHRLSILSVSSLDLSFKKRKRKIEDDELSLRSLRSTKKKNKKNTLKHIASLASIFSPGKKEDNNFKVPSSCSKLARTPTPYREPRPLPTRRRLTRTWSDMMCDVGYSLPSALSHGDVKRQEAIFELYQGEVDIVEDLNVVHKMYLQSMRKLNILSEDEISQIFGQIENLIPLHKELIGKLQTQRKNDGTTCDVGDAILTWTKELRPYADYCSNQVFAKALLDEKKSDACMDDFLQRCMESPFSRKLDLWTLLDGARSRFMKYPLLIRSIQKYTRPNHSDINCLEEAVKCLESLIGEADKQTGEAKCKFYRCKLSYLFDEQQHPLIEQSKSLILNGVLKNNKGTKLHVFLFDRIVVVTRATSHSGRLAYQVYREPIPLHELHLDDLKDGAVKVGSFRSAFTNTNTAKNAFRLSFNTVSDGQAHTLLANDEHNKRQWMLAISKALLDITGPNNCGETRLDEDEGMAGEPTSRGDPGKGNTVS